MIRIGVIGYGYWGPNIVRNIKATKGCVLAKVCDTNEASVNRFREAYPGVSATQNPAEITQATDIDAVAVVTPVATHYALASEALNHGKHVLLEKPLAASTEEASRLIDLASAKQLTLMVDHTFLFTGAVRKIKELVDADTLGKLYYYDSTRVNLGLFQHDVNVIWDLAPHDLAIMDYVIPEKPRMVVATGVGHFNPSIEDVAYLTLYFDSGMIAHFNVNWLAPVKIRLTLIGGEKKMVVWDDMEQAEKLKVYDKGVRVDEKQSIYKTLMDYRSGDMWSPRVDHVEALKLELDYFIHCIGSGTKPFNDGESGLRVVRVLEAAERSIKNGGAGVKL